MNDPGQHKLPTHLRSKLPTIYDEMKDFLKGIRMNISEQEMEKLSKAHKDFMFYGFVSLTGINPQNVMLIERHYEDGSVGFAYELKNPKTDWKVDIALQQAAHTIKSLNQAVQRLKDEVVKLRNDQLTNTNQKT